MYNQAELSKSELAEHVTQLKTELDQVPVWVGRKVERTEKWSHIIQTKTS